MGRRAGFFLGELAVVMLMMVVLIGFLLICIQKLQPVREAAVMVQTANNLKQLALALQNCDNTYRSMPPTCDKFGGMHFAAPVQVHLAPFCEEYDFYKAYIKANGKGEVTERVITAYLHEDDYTRVHAEGVVNFAANLRLLSDKGFKTAYEENELFRQLSTTAI